MLIFMGCLFPFAVYFHIWVLIFVWVLINADVVVVIKMGANIHGVLICVGAYYPDFTVCRHRCINCKGRERLTL